MNIDWNQQATEMFKAWQDGQKAWLESLARGPAGAFGIAGAAEQDAKKPSFTVPFASLESVREGARQMNDAWKVSVEQWMMLLNHSKSLVGNQEQIRKLFDPAEWAKPVPGSFDFGIERIIEGPSFATLWDIDRKLLKLQQLAMRRAEDTTAYHAIVFAAWNRAIEGFNRELSDREGAPLKSFRELIDLWIKTANETLIEVHRSPEFLEAQQRVTRSGTDYRLAERAIAEAYCEIHHLPTRTEVDEVQRTLYQVRRDLRALSRRLESAGQEAPRARAKRHAAKRMAKSSRGSRR